MTCDKKRSQMDRDVPPMSGPSEDHRCERHDLGEGQSCQRRKGRNQTTRSEDLGDRGDPVHAMGPLNKREGKKEKGIPTTADRPPMESSVLRPSWMFEFISSKS